MAALGTLVSARKLLVRDWRGGELGILLAAIVLAVAVVVGISVFVARLQSALESESTRFLAADMALSSRQAPPVEWSRLAQSLNLSTANTVAFTSMAYTEGDAMALASVKAVSAAYPLRGELLASVEPYGPLDAQAGVPKAGEAWLDPRLFTLLEVGLGDTVYVGEKALEVTGAIRGEPDATRSVFGLGPRLMMNTADIGATGIIQPGSRVNFRLLLRGESDALRAFEDEVAPTLIQGQQLLTIEDSQPRIGRTLDRARGFLLLAGSLGVVLAAAAVALAARRFSDRHTDYVAVMKSLGASSQQVGALYGSSLAALGVIATVFGCAAGWGIQSLFFNVFADQVPIAPGTSGITPYGIGAATALVCLLMFAWPPLRRLAVVPPLRVLRRDLEPGDAQRPIDYALGAAAIAGLMWWYSGDLRMTGGLLAGLSVTVGLGYLAARTLLAGGRRVGAQAGSVWRLAMAGLQRRGSANALQMTIFAIAIMLLLLLIMVRTSLVEQWAAQLPEGTPNHFMVNIAPEEREPLAAFLAERGIARERLYPMTRGRVMAVNATELADGGGEDAEGPRQREANFTWSAEPPDGNVLLEGAWWDAGTDEALVSLEQGFAERVGAKVGDMLTLRIGADEFSAQVGSIREVDWQSLQPNFFVVFPQRTLETYPSTYMTSFFLPPEQKATLNQLIRQYPTVSVIELDVVIREIQGIIGRVGQAIELVLLVILLAGSLVLVAGVQASVDVRLRESALLRALGARSTRLVGALWIEFTTLGCLAGLLAVVGAEAAAWLLQTQALDLAYQPNPILWPAGVLVGGLTVGILGVLACRRAVQAPPLTVLRDL
jgi:putative ABC transport system permease protein